MPADEAPCPALVAALEALSLYRQAQREAVEIDVSCGGTAADDDQHDRCLAGCGSRGLPEEEAIRPAPFEAVRSVKRKYVHIGELPTRRLEDEDES